MRLATGGSAARHSATGNVRVVSPLLRGLILRSQTDEQLVALAREGHDQAFIAIAQRYRRELIAHARRVVPTGSAEDVVQQSMLSAWSALRGQADVLDARGWLHRIVHNAALHVLQGSESHDQLSDALAAAAGTEGEVERRRDAREALAALAALPEPQRRALELTALGGYSGREAAGALNISEGALRQLVHRARTTLRAGATGLTSMPLLSWAAGGGNQPVAARLTEVCAGAGMAATVTKVCATVAVSATLISGASQVIPARHAHPTRRQGAAAAAHRGVLEGAARAETRARGPVEAPGAAATRVDRHLGDRRDAGVQVAVGLDQHGQQQSGSGSAGERVQSHQAGGNQHGVGEPDGGLAASGAAAPQETYDTTGGQGGSGAQETESEGASGASGANEP